MQGSQRVQVPKGDGCYYNLLKVGTLPHPLGPFCCPVSIDETAFVMKYTPEDTKPPLYGDMNTKAYLPNRDLIEPYGAFMASLVKSMSKMEPFPDGTVTRGVKGDLSASYPVGRKVTWHGLVSCTK